MPICSEGVGILILKTSMIITVKSQLYKKEAFGLGYPWDLKKVARLELEFVFVSGGIVL